MLAIAANNKNQVSRLSSSPSPVKTVHTLYNPRSIVTYSKSANEKSSV